VIYLASPYSHSDLLVREASFDAACRATAGLIRGGQVAYSPIVHGHPIVRFGLPTDWSFWQCQDRALLSRCDEVVVLRLDCWQASEGLRAELAVAAACAKPIRYIDPEA
jgi:hypothetical protein